VVVHPILRPAAACLLVILAFGCRKQKSAYERAFNIPVSSGLEVLHESLRETSGSNIILYIGVLSGSSNSFINLIQELDLEPAASLKNIDGVAVGSLPQQVTGAQWWTPPSISEQLESRNIYGCIVDTESFTDRIIAYKKGKTIYLFKMGRVGHPWHKWKGIKGPWVQVK
jgi:hypothetical protein